MPPQPSEDILADGGGVGGNLLPADAVMRISISKSVVGLAAASWAISLIVHYPGLPWSIYSDVVSFWLREPGLRDGRAACIDYFMEYPPASCLAVDAARILGGPSLEGFYLAFSLLSLPAYIILGLAIRGIYPDKLSTLLILSSPSLIVYGIYNFDHFVAGFLALSFLLYLRGRWLAAAAFLGVSVAFKLIPIILLPIYLMGGAVRRQVLGFLLGLIPLSIPAIINPGYVSEFIAYHTGWGLENAWYLWLAGDPFSVSAKVFGLWLMTILLIRSYLAEAGFLGKSFLSMASWYLSSYVFTPQMALWILPTIPAGGWLIYPWIAFEFANVMIILTWFTTETPTLPWTLPQTAALVRAALVAVMFASAYGWPKPSTLSRFGLRRRMFGISG